MPLVGQHVEQPVGRRPVQGVAEEVVSVDLVGLLPPGDTGVLEVADQLLLLRVHAEDRQALLPEGSDEPLEEDELLLAVGVVRPAEALDVDAQAVAQVTEQAGEYQVPGAKTFQTLNIGGSGTTSVSFVVGVEAE